MSPLSEEDKKVFETAHAEIEAEEEKEEKEREAFEKASSQEKIEKLRKYIDELEQRFSGHLDDHFEHVDVVVEQLEQKYNKLLSYIQRIAEEKDYRIVDRKTMLCEAKAGEVHNAILFFHGDGTITVKCSAYEHCDCEYGLLEF